MTDHLTIHRVRDWLSLPSTHKMRDMARHGMQPSDAELMPFVELAEAYIAAIQREERLREALERTDSAMSWLLRLQDPTPSHIERWVQDGRKLIASYLEQRNDYRVAAPASEAE